MVRGQGEPCGHERLRCPAVVDVAGSAREWRLLPARCSTGRDGSGRRGETRHDAAKANHPLEQLAVVPNERELSPGPSLPRAACPD